MSDDTTRDFLENYRSEFHGFIARCAAATAQSLAIAGLVPS